MTKNEPSDHKEDIVETNTCNTVHGTNKNGEPKYEIDIQLSRKNDPEGYKGGRLLYFNINNANLQSDPREVDKPVAQYRDGKLSYDPKNKDIPDILKNLEGMDKYDGFMPDTLDWTKTRRDQILGKTKEREQLPPIEDIPNHLNPVTKQASSPDFSLHEQTTPKPHLDDRIKTAKEEQKKREPGYTPERERDRSR